MSVNEPTASGGMNASVCAVSLCRHITWALKTAKKNVAQTSIGGNEMVVSIKNETLIAENVEVDMETLGRAQSFRVHPITRQEAQQAIVGAVLTALSWEDRKRLEAYIKGE